jgi:hypothetical protein
MSSTEDDTFKRLKSLTIEEALQIFHNVYHEALSSMEADGIDVTAGIPIFLIRHEIDERLKPYGLSWEVVYPHVAGDVS